MTYPSDLTTEKKGEVYGFDGAKKVKGRKRHLIVDSLGQVIGQVMKVVVTEANDSERIGALYGLMAWTEQYPDVVERLSSELAYVGHNGEMFRRGVCSIVGAEVERLTHPIREFAVIAKRWVVERTFAWWNLYRRLSKDYELLPEVSEAAIYAVTIHLTLRRLAPA